MIAFGLVCAVAVGCIAGFLDAARWARRMSRQSPTDSATGSTRVTRRAVPDCRRATGIPPAGSASAPSEFPRCLP